MQSCPLSEETVDPRALRNPLGRFATGVTVIFIGRVVAASCCDGEPLVFSRGEYCVPVRHAPQPEPQRLHVRGAAFPEMTR